MDLRNVEVFVDGNMIGALYGKLSETNLMESPCGFGATVPDALRNLAEEMEK